MERNGTDISGANASTLDLSLAGNGDRGDLIRVRVTVSDGSASSAPLTSAPVTIVNAAPAFSTDFGDRTDAEGDSPSLDANASDHDADSLTYSATGLPGGLSINSSTGLVSGTIAAGAAGPHAVTLGVSDGTLTDSDTFNWTVTVNNTPPVVDTASITPSSPATNATLTAAYTAHDADGDTLTPSYQWSRNGTDISGASPTTLRLRAWADGSAEPATWQYTATNAAAGLQTAGAVGLRAYTGSSVSNGPITLTFDDFRVTGIGGP